jgi:hypothetical protein
MFIGPLRPPAGADLPLWVLLTILLALGRGARSPPTMPPCGVAGATGARSGQLLLASILPANSVRVSLLTRGDQARHAV